MDKSRLERVINKYNLSGAIEKVVWTADTNVLTIRGMSDNKHVLVELTADKIELPDGEFGVCETKKLRSLLGVLGDTPTAKSVVTNGKTTGLEFADGSTNIVFALAEKTAVPPVPEYKLPVMDINVILDEKFINTYVKAKGAMPESETVTFICDGNAKKTVSVVLGHATTNKNKVSITANVKDASVLSATSFSSDYLREVLTANKEMTGGTLEISSKGIAVLKYTTDGISCTYVFRKI